MYDMRAAAFRPAPARLALNAAPNPATGTLTQGLLKLRIAHTHTFTRPLQGEP
jgi:hypothetical protein